jgi:hypothetical protein
MNPADLGKYYESILDKEVRKEEGIYYTPEYIVDYIVANSLGALLQDKTLAEATKIRIVDPACGAGVFLLGAYQYLLDWHEKHVGKLTTAKRRNILNDNIFGVDIDPLAVSITKYCLSMRCTEGKDFALDIENIRCGNSLVAEDFYTGKDMVQFSDKDMRRINAFDWNKAFPTIMKEGGFDIVIGNPPYSYMIARDIQDYFQENYQFQNYQKDLYLMFLERYSKLLKPGGKLGVIVSNTWLLSLTYQKIRQYLTSQYTWRKILYLPKPVFKAVVDTHVLVFDYESPSKKYQFDVDVYRDERYLLFHKLSSSDIPKDGSPINIMANRNLRSIADKIIKRCKQLKDFCNVFSGVVPFEKGAGDPPQTAKIMKTKPYVVEGKRPGKEWLPLLRGSLIHRYTNRWNKNYWILYGRNLAAPRDPAIFSAAEKIVVRQTGDSLIATLIGKNIICRKNLHIILNNSAFDLRFILTLVNSKLMNYVYEYLNPERGEALAEVKKAHVEILPIPPIDLSEKQTKKAYDRLIELANQMLSANENFRESVVQRGVYEQRIRILEKEINELVYKLYDLTDAEIAIVEGNV